MLPSTYASPTLLTDELSVLLRDYTKLCIKSASYTPTGCGCAPESRKIADYLKYGVINLDKPAGPSSHEVVAYVKRILKAEKTGHSGTLDPQVSGNLLVCIERATRLVKSYQEMGKTYVAILYFSNWPEYMKQTSAEQVKEFPLRVRNVAQTLTSPYLQRPPAEGCAVKRVLRVREIYGLDILEFDYKNGRILMRVDCESGTYIRVLCYHFGYLFGCDASMAELRRVRSGALTEKDNFVTLHDVMDAMWLHEHKNDESYLRKVVRPLETLLVSYKKIIVKDSAVNAVAYGAPLLIQGVVRYSPTISVGDAIVLVTTKGEAVALANAQMSAVDIAGLNHGLVAKPTRVIMDRDTYEKQWGKGEMALERIKLIEKGLLGKHGELQDNTPEEWRHRWCDVNKFLEGAGAVCANATGSVITEEVVAVKKPVAEPGAEAKKAVAKDVSEIAKPQSKEEEDPASDSKGPAGETKEEKKARKLEKKRLKELKKKQKEEEKAKKHDKKRKDE